MKTKVTKKQLRQFGILIGFGFPLVIGWLIPVLTGHFFRGWTLWIAVPSIILGILIPNSLYYPYKGWMAIGHILGWINSRIILGLVFIVVLQPIALIMKSFKYDPLRKKKVLVKSYRENKEGCKIDLTRIF